jgi:hypothetical protein
MSTPLDDLVRETPSFTSWTHVDKIKFFAWYIHVHEGKSSFSGTDILARYKLVNSEPPTSVSPFLKSLETKKPKQLLRDSNGYRLERRVRDEIDAKYGSRTSTVTVHKLLSGLPSKISSAAEKSYLAEALICFSHGAFRAAVVMAWNLSFDHLCCYIQDDANRLSLFNTQLPRSFPRADISSISKKEDFSELKESQVLLIAKSAGIVPSNIYKVLKEKLDKRNIAAHPSGIHFTQLTAEEFITDLVENAVLKLV